MRRSVLGNGGDISITISRRLPKHRDARAKDIICAYSERGVSMNGQSKIRKWIKRYKAPYLFISPFFILFLLFQLIPMVQSFYYSFTDFDGMHTPEFVGLKNYINLFKAENYAFWDSLRNTVIYWIVCSIFIIVLAFVTAMLLNHEKLKGKGFIKTATFLPYICASIAIALVFNMLFDYNSGLINDILTRLGLEKVGWLTTSKYARIPVIILFCWRSIPWYSIIILSGLLNIPGDYYESATIDGGNFAQKFFYITLPLMKNVLFFCLITTTSDTWKMFNESYILKGPAYSNATLFQYMYENAFKLFDLGYSSAIGYVLAMVMIVISIVQFIARRRQGEND